MNQATPPNLDEQQTEQLVQDAIAAIQHGDVAAANTIAEQGIEAGVEHPFLLKVHALWLHNAGRYQEALRQFHYARELSPNDPSIVNGIASCLSGMGGHDEALQMVTISLELAPQDPATHYLGGWICEAMGDVAGAARYYERTIALNPRHAPAMAGLASLAVRREDHATAERMARQALALDPRQVTAMLARAAAQIATDHAVEAQAQLESVLGAGEAAIPQRARLSALALLGDALQAQDRTEEAFAAYAKRAECARTQTQAADRDAPTPLEAVKRLTAQIEAVPADSWRPAASSIPAADGPQAHVFVMGFPNAGVKDFGRVLAALPGAVALENRSTFAELSRDYIHGADGIARLAALAGPTLEAAQASYWHQVEQAGAQTAGKIFFDCMALNAPNLPLIAKLFPNATVLFEIRDPRDVVLDGFRYELGRDAHNAGLISLDDIARFYAAVMELAQTCRNRLPLDMQDIRADDDATRLHSWFEEFCVALGIEEDALKPAKDILTTRTGGWRRYAKQLEPIRPILQPWVERFGYRD